MLWTVLAILAPTPALVHAEEPAASTKHFSVEMPASLSADEAEQVYTRIVDDMVNAYALSRDPSAIHYPRWQRFNSASYPSGPHGTRYVNVYANGQARSHYGEPMKGEAMPEGAVLAKDSFAVTEAGDAFVGPLFLMEKMAPGSDPKARDWRYSMIMPDGSYFGMTGGDNADKVEFCITCHQKAGDENDNLFFVPEKFLVARPPR